MVGFSAGEPLRAVLFVFVFLFVNQFTEASMPEKIEGDFLGQSIKQEKLAQVIAGLNRKIHGLVFSKSDSLLQVLILENSLQDVNDQISLLEADLLNSKSKIRNRILYMSRIGGSSLLSGISQAKTPAQLNDYLRIISRLARKDVQNIKKYKEQTDLLLSKKNTLVERLEAKKKKQAKLLGAEQSLAREMNLKMKVLEKLRNSREMTKQKLVELRKKAILLGQNETADLYTLLIQPSFYEKKGQIANPLSESIVSQGFGIWHDKENRLSAFHRGVYLSANGNAREKLAVKAVEDGEVIFSQPFEGYGKLVVIDHGDNYFSVYGHLKNLNINQFEVVKKGQSIGIANGNESGFGRGIYFEIRHYTEPENPEDWIKGFARGPERSKIN